MFDAFFGTEKTNGEKRFLNAFWRQRSEQAEKRRLEKSARRTLNAAMGRKTENYIQKCASAGRGDGLQRTTAYFTEVVKSAVVPILIAVAAVAFALILGAHGWPFGSSP
jgi:hypothetical protein